MADKSSSDLIMKFERKTGPIKGEARTELDFAESDMTTGFKSGYLIELQSFTLGVSVDGQDSEGKEKMKAHEDQVRAAGQSHQTTLTMVRELNERRREKGKPLIPEPQNPSGALTKPDTGESFAKWRAGQAHAPYDPDVNPVEITRSIDRASIDLLRCCISREMLNSATLIKRKAAGGKLADGRDVSGEIFLRFDFEGVMITQVDWDEDDPVKEKVKFIARAITMSYRPQLPDGSLGGVVPGFWTMAPDLKVFTLRGER